VSFGRTKRNQTSTEGVEGGSGRARYPKKGGQHLFQERQQIFRFIKEHREEFAVEKMCKVLKVSVRGYYYWLKPAIPGLAF
jgi:hypothetical protein